MNAEQEKETLWRLIAAAASCLLPGLGQIIQKRYTLGLAFFVLCFLLWFVWLGWLIHVWAVLDAAFYEEEKDR